MRRIKTAIINGKAVIDGGNVNISAATKGDKVEYVLNVNYRTAYGFGEKFDRVNQKGNVVKAAVIEKCFYQGEFTYISIPFLMSAENFGLYVDTYTEVIFDLKSDDKISFTVDLCSDGKAADIYLFEGTPKEIIAEFKKVTAPTKLFPKWILGAWMSSNRWRYQSEIEEQLEISKRLDFPHNVLVIEPWSDLSTHYYWGGSVAPEKKGDEFASYDEMSFPPSARFSDPKALIDKLHDNNIKTLLWVIPIYALDAAIEGNHNRRQRDIDNDYIVDNNHCALKPDGKPYYIPHTWNIGSMIPDFTNKEATEVWLNHFKYLLEIGVDGFKADGGEFVHERDVMFSDGTTGIEGRSRYADLYLKAFNDFCGKDRAVFARAGGAYAAANAISWAGDQESTWSEFRSIIKAGISAGLSGISNWGFDIAGFAGYLPSKTLYERTVQAAAFAPVMQWHSEPPANGRCDFSGAWSTNDRSPWNMAEYYKDDEYLTRLRKHFYLHYNLIPYQYALMLEANKNGTPAMRHLIYEFNYDEKAANIEDQFMLGDALMVCPVLDDYISDREVYFPNGVWYDLYSGEKIDGGACKHICLSKDRIPVYFRDNCCIPVNIIGGLLASNVGNNLNSYHELTFLISGEGSYTFIDDLNNEIEIEWNNRDVKTVKNSNRTEIRFLRVGKDNLF